MYILLIQNFYNFTTTVKTHSANLKYGKPLQM